MRQAQHQLAVSTRGQGLYEVTGEVAAWVRGQDIEDGLLTLFCRHTSASLTVQENADPDVCLDLQDALAGLAPRGGADRYRHHTEGPDDMPAHIKSALTATQLSIPVSGGRMALGTWQGIYLFEHRTRPGTRRVVVTVSGE